MPPPTEPTLLTRYLLPPSSLHTIIPYNQFLASLPSNLRTAAADSKTPTAIAIKRLYRDLEFQRDIDVDTVALNIQRECSRSEVLKGRLRRAIREELGQSTTNNTTGRSSRKRKRPTNDNDDDHDSDNEADTSLQPKIKAEDPQHAYDALTDPLETRLDHLFSGPRGLSRPYPLPDSQKFHSPTSLLSTLSSSISTLESEVASLNAQSASILSKMNDTVGSMSDLRYGKFAKGAGSTGSRQSMGNGTGEGDGFVEGDGVGNGLEGQVRKALRELKQVVERKKVRGNGKEVEI